ncbi:PREDICTED: sialidase-1-like [Branchiostoma belcheri]|uniref:Sialidase-1 n=1 Tax=Branchiostoma belcheri TaxID=7741 RepID=A0A6P5AJI3_BRABE|nr:PREDICTED: sialidase-1-like [Branchiostoma belcheri]
MAYLFKTRDMSGRFRLLIVASLFIIVVLTRWIGNKAQSNYEVGVIPHARKAYHSAVRSFLHQIKSVGSLVSKKAEDSSTEQVKSVNSPGAQATKGSNEQADSPVVQASKGSTKQAGSPEAQATKGSTKQAGSPAAQAPKSSTEQVKSADSSAAEAPEDSSTRQVKSAASPVDISLTETHDVVLWTSNWTGEIPVYRVPVFTYTPKGNLVAIAEGRRKSHFDKSPKIFEVRRSTDGGKTWSPPQRIVDDGKSRNKVCSYIGTIFVDDTTATIFLMYVFCEFCPTRSLMLINSTDDGITWGRPRNITDHVGKHYATHPSPGYGIQKRQEPSKGRLIVCGHGFYNGKGLVLLLSDDHGVTWRRGAFVPSVPFRPRKRKGHFDPDECQPVEFPDGSIYILIRNEKVYLRQRRKMIMRSFDGGETLPQNYTYLDQALIEPRITSGLWYHDGILFYSGPKHDTQRENLHIRWSYDHGKTWSSEKQVWRGMAGYSALMMLPHDREHLYILYERGSDYCYFDEIAVTEMKISPRKGRDAI